jgi:hypothetical protein
MSNSATNDNSSVGSQEHQSGWALSSFTTSGQRTYLVLKAPTQGGVREKIV